MEPSTARHGAAKAGPGPIRRASVALRRAVRRALFRLGGGTRFRGAVPSPELARALAGCEPASDISDHLGTLFASAVAAGPGLWVELGTRGGQSTRALLAAAEVAGATLLSVDLDDCAGLDLPHRARWHFVRGDDVAFGESGFAAWCRERSLAPSARFLFVDTSHEYDHTRRELAAWAPHLAPGATLVLHDTHMGRGVFARLDGSVGFSWDNRRGVIRALEEFLGRRYDETAFFADATPGWTVEHHPHCNGLTVLRRRGAA